MRKSVLLACFLLTAKIAQALSAGILISAAGNHLSFSYNASEPVNMTITLYPAGSPQRSLTGNVPLFQDHEGYGFADLDASTSYEWTMHLATIDGQSLDIGPYTASTQASYEPINTDTPAPTIAPTPAQELPTIREPIAAPIMQEEKASSFLGIQAPANSTTAKNIANIERGFWGIFDLAPTWGTLLGVGIMTMIILAFASVGIILQNR